MIDFASTLTDQPGVVMFQCFAGISRSAGAALLSLALWYGPGEEERAVRNLIRTRPAAQPHVDLIRFGDEALGRNGRLTHALAAIQRQRM